MLNKPRTVLYTESRSEFYFTVIDMGTETFIYSNDYNLHKGNHLKTRLYRSTGTDKFGQASMIFKKNCLSHNFHPFRGADGMLYGIGGMHSWKNQSLWHKIKSFAHFKDVFLEEFGRDYKGNEDRFKKANYRLINEKFMLEYSDGLYLFKSEDGISWIRIKRIITPRHPGFHSSLAWKSTEFDGAICCLHDGQKYILYLRDNVKEGMRNIQYATSTDLLNWSEFKPIKIKYNEGDNYYFPSFFKYQDKLYGLLPFYTYSSACIRFCQSSDGITWKIKRELLTGKPEIHSGKRKNYYHPATGYVEDVDKIYVYIQHNYMGSNKKMDVYLKRYSIDKCKL